MKPCSLLMLFICALLFSCSNDTPDESSGWKSEEERAAKLNPHFVSVDWDNTKVKSFNSKDWTFTLQQTAETEKIQKGSVLAIYADTVGCITIVNSVKRSNGNVEITGREGALCDIFANTDFYLSTSADAEKTRTSGCAVYYPEKIICRDDATHRMKAVSFTRGSKWTDKLWDWVAPVSYGLKLYETAGSKIGIKEARYSADLDLDLYFSFGERTLEATKEEAYRQYRSNSLAMKAVLNGNINAFNSIEEETHASVSVNKETKLWENMFKPVRMVFYPGGVPVVITLSADLLGGISGKLSGKQKVNFGVSTNIEGKFGFEWVQSSGMTEVRSLDITNELSHPTVENTGSIDIKASIWPRIFLTLYESAAVTFDICPYLSSSVSGGYTVGDYADGTATGKGGGSAYQISLNAGVDCTAGLSPMFFSHELYHYQLKNINAFDCTLFESPSGMQVLHPTTAEMCPGITNKVQVEVYDKVINGEPTPTLLPQLVKFEGDGVISAAYAITSNGIASIDWIPSSYKDKLTATLYNGNGGIIKQVVINGNGEVRPPTSGSLIDLGLSVKWASHNVGANSPEERGDLFAWGEVSTKSNFSIANYKFYEPIEHQHAGLYQSDFTLPGNSNLIYNTEFDAAKVNMGGGYRMPKKKEMAELLDKCEKNLVVYKGVKGLMLTGPNGNSIFLPAGSAPGFLDEDVNTKFPLSDITLSYWTGNLCSSSWPTAYGFHLSWHDATPYFVVSSVNRCGGACVRAVGN